ncbi:MAG: sulfite oxidase heme-binding subunit YedZ [Burkholderiales bacterium]
MKALADISTHAVARIRIFVFALALLPLFRLIAGAPLEWLGANPIEFITRSTGTWTLVFLLITLGVTPLRRLTGWAWMLRFRRMLGLFAFFYGVLHFTTYIWLDQFFDAEEIVKDIIKRPFITIGFTAFLLMIPLAVTSTSTMVRRLGGRRWRQLHRLVYVLAVCAVVHYWWLVKRDLTEPILYALVLAILLGARVHWILAERRRASARPDRPRATESA